MNLKKYIFPLSLLGTGVGFSVIFRDEMGGKRHKGDEKLHGRTVLITGTTSGLGEETAKDLAKRGGRILMACRDMDKCEEVRSKIMEESFNKNIKCYKLDLESLQSVRECAEEINKNEKRLDILINNAGVMGIKEKQITKDGFELQLGVNYLAPFLLTNLLLDKLKSSSPSRIVNITCISFQKGRLNFKDFNSDNMYDMKNAYNQSKLALYNFSKELAERLRGTRVSVYSVHPGVCSTNIARHFGMNKSVLTTSFMWPFWWFILKTPEQGIQTTLHCALEPYEAYFSGGYYEECTLNDTLSPKLYIRPDAARLWTISEKWTGLKEH